MEKFTQAVHSVLIATMVVGLAGLAGCEKFEKAPPPPPAPVIQLTAGGTVTGLAAGDELVLQLNGADELSVKADGRFKFPKPLSKGSAYDVTVKTSPASPVRQTCVVSLGSGSIAEAPVSNVAVSCTTNTFAIGGTVTGLSGKGLVLELLGVKEVAIAKNGNFVFPGTRLPDGSDFKVAIKATPAKQSCSIQPVNTAPDSDTINIVAVTCSKKGSRK